MECELIESTEAAGAKVIGTEHWTNKGDVRLFLWEKCVGSPQGKPVALFVHGVLLPGISGAISSSISPTSGAASHSTCSRMARPKSATTRDQVRQLMLALLPAGRCSLKTVAHNLGVDRQTVHRHLVASGATYTKVLEEVRGELAARYVAEGDRHLAQIGEMLGFSEPSAFSRWFRRRFGKCPSAWRARPSLPS